MPKEPSILEQGMLLLPPIHRQHASPHKHSLVVYSYDFGLDDEIHHRHGAGEVGCDGNGVCPNYSWQVSC